MNNDDIIETSLIVKHLPQFFSHNDCEELFSFFKTKTITFFSKPGPMQNTAIITFDCFKDANAALFCLHERRIVNTRLNVQFLKVKTNIKYGEADANIEKNANINNQMTNKIPEWVNNLLAIAPKWGLNGPVQPKLKYNYPKPNLVILTNIVRSLMANENFYTQTLHLMNKFHFPVPFTPEITFPGNVVVVNNTDVSTNRRMKRNRDKGIGTAEMEISSGNESEISDEEHFPQIKRQKLSFPKIPSNPLTNNYEFKTQPTKCIPLVDAFERKEEKSGSHIEFRPIASLPDTSINSNGNLSDSTVENGFGTIPKPETESVELYPKENITETSQISHLINESINLMFDDFKLRKEKIVKNYDSKSDENSANHIRKPDVFISLDEIKSGVLPVSEWHSVNALKNYHRGIPSNQLYIKNISKKVSKDCLISLYAGFVDWSNPAEIAAFQVNYFTEGRMKGQAFVSFISQSVAKEALELTNAFKLIDKPVSVQFSRNSQS